MNEISKELIARGIVFSRISINVTKEDIIVTIGNRNFIIDDMKDESGIVSNDISIKQFIDLIYETINDEPFVEFNPDGSVNENESPDFCYYLSILEKDIVDIKAPSKWREIKNSFFNESERFTSIDAYKTNNENEEGKVIAKVYFNGNIEYLDKSAENDFLALEKILDVLNEIISH